MTSKQSFFSSGALTIPAGQTTSYNCTGQLFICKESSDTFSMSFNDGDFFLMECGLGFRLEGTDGFTKLSFRNDTTSDIGITFYTGVGEIRDARLNTTVSRLGLVQMKELPTSTQGHGAVGAYLTAPNSDPGTRYLGMVTVGLVTKQRKQIIFQNVDATNALWITDADGAVLAVIPAGQMWTVESSGTFYARGSGATCSYVVCETFYT